MRVNSRKKPKWLSLSHVYDICPTSIPWKLSRTCFLPSFRQKVTTLLFWIIDINNYSVARSIDSDYGQNFSKNARNVIFMFFRRGLFSALYAREMYKNIGFAAPLQDARVESESESETAVEWSVDLNRWLDVITN